MDQLRERFTTEEHEWWTGQATAGSLGTASRTATTATIMAAGCRPSSTPTGSHRTGSHRDPPRTHRGGRMTDAHKLRTMPRSRADIAEDSRSRSRPSPLDDDRADMESRPQQIGRLHSRNSTRTTTRRHGSDACLRRGRQDARPHRRPRPASRSPRPSAASRRNGTRLMHPKTTPRSSSQTSTSRNWSA